MTTTVPAHLAGLTEAQRAGVRAAAAEAHRLDPPPALSASLREQLAVLLRRPARPAQRGAA